MVLEGGYNFKSSPFWGTKFSLVRNMWGGGSNFMTQQQQSREFDVSDLSSQKQNDNNCIHSHKQLNFNILNKVK